MVDEKEFLEKIKNLEFIDSEIEKILEDDNPNHERFEELKIWRACIFHDIIWD